jgi:hypothetical protein
MKIDFIRQRIGAPKGLQRSKKNTEMLTFSSLNIGQNPYQLL